MISISKITPQQIIHEIKYFVLSGPAILGWIYGILHYPANSNFFLVSIQNGLISITFLTVYAFFYVFSLLFHLPSDIALLFIESLVSFTYLGITFYCYVNFRKNEKITGLQTVQSLLDRAILILSK